MTTYNTSKTIHGLSKEVLAVIFLSIRQFYLRILSERITCIAINHKRQSITRDNRHKDFPWGNHKRENPVASLEIESAPKVKLKIIR